MPRIVFWPFSEDAGLNPYVGLAWTESVDPGTEYNLYRSLVTGGPYTLIESVPSSQNSANDNQVARGTTYFYVATSYNGSQESVNSNEASATPS